MYLSQLILNPRNRQVRSELARPYELHRTVMSAFTPQEEGERVLYRLEVPASDGIPRLLVQSRHAPDWARLQGKDGYLVQLPGDNPQVREYNPQVQKGQRLAFRLLANPTRSLPAEGEPRGRGKRVTIGRPDDQAAWLARKASGGGFRIISLRITNLGEQRLAVPDEAGRGMHAARHWAVRFEGELEVTDPTAFLKTLETGIGSAKGFGYGMLSIAPVS